MFKTKKELWKDKQVHILTELRVLRWCAERTPDVKRRIENLRLENPYSGRLSIHCAWGLASELGSSLMQ
jgi:hypothetical protein